MADRQTLQIPERSMMQEALFGLLDLIPQGAQQSILNRPQLPPLKQLGQQVPPPGGGDIQSTGNILGRALVGMGRDLTSAPPSIDLGDAGKPLIDSPFGKELMTGITGRTPAVPPESLPRTPPPTQQAMPQQAPATTPEDIQGGEAGGGGFQIPAFLKNPEFLKMLPTLIAGGVGMASGRALPGAAGFATGFEGEKARQREAQEKAALTGARSTKESASILKQRKSIQSARSVVGTLKEALAKIPSHSGIGARAAGVAGSAQAMAGYNTEVSTFSKLRKSVLGQLAKIVSGESGRLTDQDIARIEAAIPTVYSTTDEREVAWGLMEEILNDQAYIFGDDSVRDESNSISVEDYVSGIDAGGIDFSSFSDEELKAIAGGK